MMRRQAIRNNNNNNNNSNNNNNNNNNDNCPHQFIGENVNSTNAFRRKTKVYCIVMSVGTLSLSVITTTTMMMIGNPLEYHSSIAADIVHRYYSSVATYSNRDNHHLDSHKRTMKTLDNSEILEKDLQGKRNRENQRILFRSRLQQTSSQQHHHQHGNTAFQTTRQYKKHRHPRILPFIYFYTEGTTQTKQILLYHSDHSLSDTPTTNSSRHDTISYPASIPSINETDITPVQPHWYQANALQFLQHDERQTTTKAASCEPMYQWQVESRVNCNTFHELQWKEMWMINMGGSRIAFQIPLSPTIAPMPKSYVNSPLVYKTIKFSSDVHAYSIEQQRRDAVVMERASSSNFIPELYGYCSVGVLMDYMPEGNMHDYVKGVRLGGGTTLPSVDRLRIAIHIATSVADLHGTGDDPTVPAFYHNDVCCHQFLFQDGIFKLNDFNYAKPILRNTHTKEICLRNTLDMGMWKGRSLEDHQCAIKSTGDNTITWGPFRPDTTDVWMMGNVIYIILTDWYTFEKPERLSLAKTTAVLVAGGRSPYPKHIETTTDPSLMAMKQALDMCWRQDWRMRSSAHEVSEYLMAQLRKIVGEDDPDLRVKLPERKADQKATDSEFIKNGY